MSANPFKKLPRPQINYLNLRPRNLFSTEFRHLLLLLYWPLFSAAFMWIEHCYPATYYYPIYSPLDDLIPFCELFVIPYIFWFAYQILMHLYTGLYDLENFRKMMYYIMITHTLTLVIFLLFPNCQLLRPAAFARDNMLTRFMAGFYAFDTHTNVFPSLHVIGSTTVMFTAFHCRGIGRKMRTAIVIAGLFICMSTVFLKQHSILDTFGAIPVCLIGYYFAFRFRRRKSAGAVEQAA